MKAPAKILVVDDDPNLIQLIRMRLESANYEVTAALEEQEALAAARGDSYDLSIVDLRLLHQDGLTLMEALHEVQPDMPVIILTAHGTIENAVEAIKRGAYGYLTKPFDPRDLLLQVEKALETRRLTSEIKRLRDLLEQRYAFPNIVAKSAKMQQVLEAVTRIAPTDSTVYLQGESGTGKEVIAKAIHLASPRKDKPFVAINCAAIPESLLESELFGHEKGAFTGAVRSTKGLFTQADEGTLFLDEIGELPLGIQAKLLRALEERQFYPIGAERPVKVNVRVIVATKKDLEQEVKRGLFREDLFYRIHVIPIHLPPLRERKEDIPHLVDAFLQKLSQQMKKHVRRLTPRAMQKLMLHDWPGNVRELENTIEYAVAMTEQDVITEEHILQTRSSPADSAATAQPVRTLRESKAAFEKEYLINLLRACEGNVSRAAKLAGKYRADFYDLLKKHGIRPQDFKPAT
jgi:two-component system response regulator GlrR